MKKILIIQTAFIGDVVLATALVEQIIKYMPGSEIHFLLRKGNEVLLKDNPYISKVWVWDKRKKYRSLFHNVIELRKQKFDFLFNLQRFFNSGLMMSLINSKFKSCFQQNPLSFLAHKKVIHNMSGGHEVERNSLLLPENWNVSFEKPKLHFCDLPKVNKFLSAQQQVDQRYYVVMAPNSVWETKQWPKGKWKKLADRCVESNVDVHFIGAPQDFNDCEMLREGIEERSFNHCGQMSLHESAGLMRQAKRVFANDSAALHLASSVNAPSTGIFCSTTKSFGFYGVSDDAVTLERLDLECKPCGSHGKKQCPLKHFECSEISVENVFKSLKL